MIALIDYKAGNLTSVRKALAAIEAEVFTPDTPDDLARARGVIVPGVGHFGATRALDREWIDAILARVGDGCPLLGICLGMQWLYEGSEEAPDLPGLGLLSGSCRRLRPAAADVPIKVPHVGWNSLNLTADASIVEGVADQRAGLLHAQLRGADHRTHRSHDGTRRSLRRDRSARTGRRRAVSPGEVR